MNDEKKTIFLRYFHVSYLALYFKNNCITYNIMFSDETPIIPRKKKNEGGPDEDVG